MSKPAFEDIFAFAGRRNRKSYILYGLGVLAGGFVVYAVVGVIAAIAHV